MTQAQLDQENMGIEKYFLTKKEQNGLYAYHAKGCQIIDFGETASCPGQADILTAMKIKGINVEQIVGLQNMGRNRYMLYPKNPENPILEDEEFMVKDSKGIILQPSPIFRDTQGRRTDIFISGLPLEIGNEAIIKKFIRKFKINILNDKKATIWGFQNVYSGVRILTIKREDTKKVPTFFYVMGFLVKTWYRGSEMERTCSRCGDVGHKPRDCPNPMNQQPKTYATVAATNIETIVIPRETILESVEVQSTLREKSEDIQREKTELSENIAEIPLLQTKWDEILSPATYRFINEELLKENPFNAIQEEDEQGDISGIIPITSTPMREEDNVRKKRKVGNLSSSSLEKTPVKKKLKDRKRSLSEKKKPKGKKKDRRGRIEEFRSDDSEESPKESPKEKEKKDSETESEYETSNEAEDTRENENNLMETETIESSKKEKEESNEERRLLEEIRNENEESGTEKSIAHSLQESTEIHL